jgi:hypothetical protein
MGARQMGGRTAIALACIALAVGCGDGDDTHAADPGADGGGSGGSGGTGGGSGSGGSGGSDGGVCVPQCDGVVCGDDGCNGVCGTCESTQTCTVAGQCCACEGGPPVPMALSFSALPATQDFRAPGRGSESWHGADEVDVPAEGAAQQSLDVYYRSYFTWAVLEPSQGSYDFSAIETRLQAAIDKRQKFSFGIMTVYPDDEANPSPSDQGVKMSYPLYLHQLMQNAGDAKNHGATDWNSPSGGWWLPNYNSEHYLDRFDALNAALNDWLNTKSYAGFAYKDVIGYIDVRGFGSWGEWHHHPFISQASQPDGSAGSWPVGMRPTVTSLKRIVDSYVKNFPKFQLASMVAAFDAEWLNNTWNPPEIAQHILDAKNDVGPLGWRRDQWASDAQYLHDYLENNNRSVPGGSPFKNAIMERWKQAPILGEPECSGTDMALLPQQVSFYHATMVGNSNYCTSVTSALANNVREASRRMGYRIVLTGGSAPHSANRGQTMPVTLEWQNVGVAPTYEKWTIQFELQDRTSGVVIWSAPSGHVLYRFLPDTTPTGVTDQLFLPADLAPGDYRFVVKVVDPVGYRAPLPLALEGRRSDGSYTLVDSFTLGTCKGC